MSLKLKNLIYGNLLILLALSVCNLKAAYQTLPFNVFTNNTPYKGDLHINVMVTDAGPGEVEFTFSNTSTIASSISNLYFDGDPLLRITGITQGPGTSFDIYPIPGNLPGGNLLTPAFDAVKDLSIGVSPPPVKSGINPGQWITVQFAINDGSSWQSIMEELQTGDLRIGAHIIGLPFGSESAVSIPEPGTIFMLGIGASVLRRRIKKRI